MKPTDELRLELRELLDEVIPEGKTDSDTRFTVTQVDRMLTVARDVNEAAAYGWKLKAARAMSERGGLEETQSGDEKHKFIKLTEYRDHCLAMAKMYAGMSSSSGSRLLRFEPSADSDVLGSGSKASDLSRLMGID